MPNTFDRREREAGFNPADLIELLCWRAEHQPEQRAYTFLSDGETEKASLTYRELDRQARVIGAWLQSMKVAGERALLLYPPGLEYISAFFGCLYAGVVAVPAYPPLLNRNLPRLEAIATNAQAALALTTTPILATSKRVLSEAPALAGLRWLATDRIGEVNEDQWREHAAGADALAFLQYTSGSTGTPKGVMVSHGNLLHNMGAVCERFELLSHRCGLGWQPLFHDMGLIGMVLNPLYACFPMMLMSPLAFLQHPFRWLQAISKYGVTYSGAPSFAYDLCVRAISPAQCESLDLSSWSLAAVGAEPIRKDALDRFVQAFAPFSFHEEALYPCYGLAEATLIVTGGPRSPRPLAKTVLKSGLEENRAVEAPAGAEGAQELVGCGKVLPGQKVVLVNPETFEVSAPGEVGEVWVSGPSVARGYWNRPEETAETFGARLAGGGTETFMRTGDLGFADAGELYITGRHKDLIIIRGLNYYPQDIEHTVQESHAELRPACGAAFSVEASGEERLVIVQELENDAGDSGEIFDAIRRSVAEEYEVPVYSIVLIKYGTMPMTSSGKIQRRACRVRFLEDGLDKVASWREAHPVGGEPLGAGAARVAATLREGSAAPSRTAVEIEAWLVARLAARLGVGPKEIDLLRPFASYGFDSKEAVGLSAEVEAWLGRRLPPTLAWDYPNIKELSRHLAGSAKVRKLEHEGRRTAANEEPIAVIGIGCRFPGAINPDEFWQLLRDGVDAVSDVPTARWDADAFYDPRPATPGKMNTRWGGFVEGIEQFDPQFFGISPREAVRTDPQQRLLMEVTWEALEHAALTPQRLAGTQTGVFIGISSNDYARLLLRDLDSADVYDGTGNALSIAANRLSYLLDLRGPSVAVDTACSSSLVAVHMACQSLRAGESSLVLAGGVNLTLLPDVTVNLSQARMMSADGRCKPFDASADGYVRGEGCGVVVLKRLSEAEADGDRVLAIIRGTAVNQDGRSNGLTAPNGPAQQSVIRAALHSAGVEPWQLGYVEAHGSGTPLGDPIEFQALEAVLKEGRMPGGARCVVGSVKTNIGHLEAAAGVAGLIKVVLALGHKEIPAHLHLHKVNPHISLEESPLAIVTERTRWPPALDGRRYAGVSSFGFGGTNAHVILEEAHDSPTSAESAVERPLHVLTLSALTEGALRELAHRYAERLAGDAADALADVCYTANAGRARFDYRLAVIADSPRQAADELATYASGGESRALLRGHARGGRGPKVAFLFSGQGAQYEGMGRELYRTQPTFRRALERCAAILDRRLEHPLLSVMFPAVGALTPLHETAYTQPTLFALEYALAELWRSWGVEPDAVMGHSIGEYVAACVAGVFTVEEGLELIAERGRLMQELPARGTMAVVLESVSRITPVLEEYAGQVSVAAVNGPSNTVISGDEGAVREVRDRLEAKGLTVTTLPNVARAFHSPLMEPMLGELERVAGRVRLAPPSIPLVSNLTGRVVTDVETFTAQYWRRHAREAVQFAPGIDSLAGMDCEIFVEIGPGTTLVGMGRRCIREAATWLHSLKQGQSDWRILLGSVAELFLRGREVDWEGFDRDYPRRKVSLPTYPFERRRYWVEPSEARAPATTRPLPPKQKAAHPLLGRQLN
jgi:acyl transferase domain-containing protein/acyl-CoA synthetase (AMP-forming)/AMP-acid ligase II/acyl carrier protein